MNKRTPTRKMPPAEESATAAPLVDVGILTIRTDEFRAVLDAFPKGHRVHQGKTRQYTLRQADGADGERYTIAILRQVEQGNGEAQDAARDMLDDLEPTMLLVVGIAAGLPSDDITLGDVVISTRVNEYTVEARKAKDKTTYSMSGGPVAKELQGRVANLVGREKELGNWAGKLPRRPKVSWSRTGQLYGSKRWQNELREKLEGHFGRGVKERRPVFAAGPIASSDRLVKDPAVLIPWLETSRHLHAIEMEAAGVYRAARERCLMLAIRGLSDIVGLKRSDAWTKFACLSAAAFTRAFLRTQPIAAKRSGEKTVAKGAVGSSRSADDAIRRRDRLYLNMAPVLEFPKSIFVAPSACSTVKQAWYVLREGHTGFLSSAWALHGGQVFSFGDPLSGPLAAIVDNSRVEEHEAKMWAESTDPDQRRLFAQLLTGALTDDLRLSGVRFARDDRVYYFFGTPDYPPRRYGFKNVKLNSTMTVVSQYPLKDATGVITGKLLRHLAFGGRFRNIEGIYHLEIIPTYRFTLDGRRKFFGHEQSLSRIKRIERNRSVLSQVLLWSAVLSADAPGGSPARLLRFGEVPSFEVDQPIGDEELTSVEVRVESDATDSEALLVEPDMLEEGE